jgi:ribosome-binding factor A
MKPKRINRLNSLLKEVITEVILQDLRNPNISKFITITYVEITKDLKHAKVGVSIIASDDEKNKTIKALNQASGFIAVHSSKKVVMRYFPKLSFELDNSVDKLMKIDSILSKINKEKDNRSNSNDK